MHFMYCDLGYANSHVTHRETKVKGHTLWGTHAAGHAGHKKYKSDIYLLKYTPEIIFYKHDEHR